LSGAKAAALGIARAEKIRLRRQDGFRNITDDFFSSRAQHTIVVRPFVNPARSLIIAKLARRLLALAIRVNLRRAGKILSPFRAIVFNAVEQFFNSSRGMASTEPLRNEPSLFRR